MRISTLKFACAASLALAMCSAAAIAQTKPSGPPQDARKLSEIIAKVEQRPDFRYISAVDWDHDGYDVTYFTTDQAKVEMKFDPVSGNPKPMQ